MRRKATAFVLVPLLFTLSSCYKLEADIEVKEDATVSGKMIIGVSKTLMDQMGEEPESMFEEDNDDYPEGAEVKPWENDDFIGEEVTFEDLTFEAFNDDGDEFTFEQDGDSFVMELKGSDDMAGGDMGAMGEMFEGMPDPQIDFRVEFPGDITDHTGPGEVDGNVLTLGLEDIESGEDVRVVADSEGGGLPVLPLVALLAFLAVIGAAVFMFKDKLAGLASSGNDNASIDPAPQAARSDYPSSPSSHEEASLPTLNIADPEDDGYEQPLPPM